VFSLNNSRCLSITFVKILDSLKRTEEVETNGNNGMGVGNIFLFEIVKTNVF